MKTRWLITLAIVSWVGPVVRSGDPATDRDKIQGTWKIVSLESGGDVFPPEKLKGASITITATKLRFPKLLGGDKEGTSYQLDPSKKPRQMKLTYQGKTWSAIYLLKGDDLKLCWNASKPEVLPTEFSSKAIPGSDIRLFVLKREKK
jgi:uncharacterized protein (TIGR03067 family)